VSVLNHWGFRGRVAYVVVSSVIRLRFCSVSLMIKNRKLFVCEGLKPDLYLIFNLARPRTVYEKLEEEKFSRRVPSVNMSSRVRALALA
jgi:hypothetical protein